jgi:hypothetical protein
MWFDETESDNEFPSSEITPPPVLRSSVSTPYDPRHNKAWSPVSLRSARKQPSRSSVQDFSLLTKFVSNVRTSIHDNHILKQLVRRNNSDINNEEVD